MLLINYDMIVEGIMLSNGKKIMKELYEIKDYLIDNKLKSVNFNTLDLTEIVDEHDSKPTKEKNQITLDTSDKNMTTEALMIKVLEAELKKWLDKNLPNIVKQAVDKEIRKITPKYG